MSGPRDGAPRRAAVPGPVHRIRRERLRGDPSDPDMLLVRREALRVGFRIAVACAVAVVLLVGAAVVLVLRRVSLEELFAGDHEAHVVLGANDLIEAGVLVGVLAILASGVIGLLSARRALAPMAAALARQRRFVADASHELRTPATVLDMRLQVLRRSLDPEDPHREAVDALLRDSRRLGGVVTDMLASVEEDLHPADGARRDRRGAAGSSAPAGTSGPARSSALSDPDVVDAAGVARAVAEDLRPVSDEHRVRIECSAPLRALLVPLSGARLHRVLTALVDNAVKHSPAGSIVEVTVGARARAVHLSVRDHGPGIQGIEVDRVFDRFARSSDAVDGGGDARTGFGIGLSLVRDAVTRAGGRVRVAETGEEGTTFEIVLPLVPEAPHRPLPSSRRADT